MNKNKLKLLLEIFITFFKLGAVSFGGGYSMVSIIEREVVEEKKWIEKDKIVDIFAVSQSLPGAIALNTSAFVGYYVAGIPGAIIALLGNMTPSVIIVLVLSVIYDKISSNLYVNAAFKGINAAIVGLIAYAAYKIGITAIKDKFCIVIMVVTFIGIMFLHLDPILVIIAGAALGLIITSVKSIRNAKKNADENEKEGVDK